MRKRLKNNSLLFKALMLVFLFSCKEKHEHDTDTSKKVMYTCPMPEDAFFSDKPGTCLKCGMDLVKVSNHHEPDNQQAMAKIFACPMHPEIISDKPGKCPVCGMDLVEKLENIHSEKPDLGALTQPVNQTILASVSTIKPEQKSIPKVIEAFGYISYNPKNTHSIASRYSGRIDKLYVKYNFQPVKKGDKIMEIYSPELVTAQEDLIFLLNTEQGNQELINAGKEKLKLLGMDNKQITQVVEKRKPTLLMTLYSEVDGHLHQMGNDLSDITSFAAKSENGNTGMGSIEENTASTTIKEGMYVEKGQTVFNVIGTGKMWAILKIFPQDIPFVKTGQQVELSSEMLPDEIISDYIDFIEPVFIDGSKYLSARVYLEGSTHEQHKFKIGSFIRANIMAGNQNGLWIPTQAVIDLGNAVFAVFVKEGNVFKSRKIVTGTTIGKMLEVKGGLSSTDEIASNAQYLIDSEGFVKTNQ